ncbi:MAG: sulfite exporter TauE/SafE family protein [Campylobacterota bacterium]|nr:sulfite exporter TauE/SafE family protein [Campylobacterota bacterium]
MTLILLGILTGFISGFFGVGGGMFLVPMLLLAGFDMKSAVAISIMQMVFSSIYGSFLNLKNNKDIFKDGLTIGLGGFLGGSLSGIIISNIDAQYLKYLFIAIVLFAIYKVTFTSSVKNSDHTTIHNKYLLLILGFIIGMIAMSIGVGGSVMLTPILAGYMYYNLKDASSLGLFFVIFSSVAGFLSLSISGHMNYEDGSIVGIASLIGVYFGIKIKNTIQIKSYKYMILSLYLLILLSMLYRL